MRLLKLRDVLTLRYLLNQQLDKDSNRIMFIRKFPSTILALLVSHSLYLSDNSNWYPIKVVARMQVLWPVRSSAYILKWKQRSKGSGHTHAAFHLLSHSDFESVSQIVRIRSILSRVTLWQYIIYHYCLTLPPSHDVTFYFILKN